LLFDAARSTPLKQADSVLAQGKRMKFFASFVHKRSACSFLKKRTKKLS